MRKDAEIKSNFVEDHLNENTLPPGEYLVDRPIKLESTKQITATNVVLYTKDNHDVLHIENDRFYIRDLKIDTSLVKDATPDVALIRVKYRKIKQTMSVLDNVSLVGSIFDNQGRLTLGNGHTGFLTDAHSETTNISIPEHSGSMGYLHWLTMNIFAEGLDTVFNIRHERVDDTHVPLSVIDIFLRAGKVKQMADITAGGTRFEYRYNNYRTLLEEERDRDLVALYGDNSTLTIGMSDYMKWRKSPEKKKGQDQYRHRYAGSMYGSNNTVINRGGAAWCRKTDEFPDGLDIHNFPDDMFNSEP